ncbi:MAG: translation initiation factor IF-3 [Candidatus Omnitrophota bacterium]
MTIEKRLRINEQIRIKEIRAIGPEGEQLGLITPQEGLRIAREKSLDLVEVSPFADPPVCRIMDYSKFKYEQDKREKEARKRQHIVKMKEVRYKPRIEEHDYQTKLNHIKDFVKKGNRVKISMMFRGRELAHTDIGREVMKRVAEDLVGIAEVEKLPMREGRFLNMIIAPK